MALCNGLSGSEATEYSRGNFIHRKCSLLDKRFFYCLSKREHTKYLISGFLIFRNNIMIDLNADLKKIFILKCVYNTLISESNSFQNPADLSVSESEGRFR